MGGSLIQLVAKGTQNDLYLTGNPQITFFKSVYRRHTNFSVESVEQTFNTAGDFGNDITSIISRHGDLVDRMWLQVKLPSATSVITSSGSSYKNWTNSVGYALIKEASVFIGDILIDRHYGEWYDIWNEFTDPYNGDGGREWNMVGKKDSYNTLATNQTNSTRYYIPLKFWFNRNHGLALPLIALQYTEIKIKISLRELNELVVTDGTSVTTSGSITECKLYTDYIYLDTDERRRFAINSHEYLIEQLQYSTYNIVAGDNSITLNLNHPVKELIWAFRNTDRATIDTTPALNLLTSDTNGNDWFNYQAISINTDLGLNTYDHFNTCTLSLNSIDRFSERDAIYFTEVQSYQHHSNTPRKELYCYSFALRPEEHQPSGTCNFSIIDNSQLKFSNCITSELLLYAVNYNVFRVMSGLGGLAFY